MTTASLSFTNNQHQINTTDQERTNNLYKTLSKMARRQVDASPTYSVMIRSIARDAHKIHEAANEGSLSRLGQETLSKAATALEKIVKKKPPSWLIGLSRLSQVLLNNATDRTNQIAILTFHIQGRALDEVARLEKQEKTEKESDFEEQIDTTPHAAPSLSMTTFTNDIPPSNTPQLSSTTIATDIASELPPIDDAFGIDEKKRFTSFANFVLEILRDESANPLWSLLPNPTNPYSNLLNAFDDSRRKIVLDGLFQEDSGRTIIQRLAYPKALDFRQTTYSGRCNSVTIIPTAIQHCSNLKDIDAAQEFSISDLEEQNITVPSVLRIRFESSLFDSNKAREVYLKRLQAVFPNAQVQYGQFTSI